MIASYTKISLDFNKFFDDKWIWFFWFETKNYILLTVDMIIHQINKHTVYPVILWIIGMYKQEIVRS